METFPCHLDEQSHTEITEVEVLHVQSTEINCEEADKCHSVLTTLGDDLFVLLSIECC